MRTLITAGPTREPIDAVRYIGNRSSGKMGAGIVAAALGAGHAVTLICGPVAFPMPPGARRIDVGSSTQMHAAVLAEFPSHDLLIMAAAVADYRPIHVRPDKTPRLETLIIDCEPTADILADAGRIKQPHQRTIGFSLEAQGNLDRAREKLLRKRCDLIVYNTTETMNSDQVNATLVWPDGGTETMGAMDKPAFAEALIARAAALFAMK